jgi:hypothetical protein
MKIPDFIKKVEESGAFRVTKIALRPVAANVDAPG